MIQDRILHPPYVADFFLYAFVVIWAIGFTIQELNKNKSTNLERNDSVTLRDFPVSNWDSENDAQEIVDWYNRKSGEDKTVSDFMELCEVTKFDSRNDAQKLLDAAMLFLETINQQEESGENLIGVSIYDPLELDKILKFFLPDIVQLPISIADQRFLETGYILDLRRKGVEVHGRSVFLQGLLLQELDEISGNFAPIYDRLELINSKGLDLSMSKLEACLKFVFQVKELSNIIIGLTSENDLKQILQCLSKMEEKYVDFSDLAIRQEQFINPTFWE